jgi:glycosyltransferase involved in cell wall biosynthesis
MRALIPRYCDTNQQFIDRFGATVFAELRARTTRLRALAALPPGMAGQPRSCYEEHYGRMLMYGCESANRVITPTGTVAEELSQVLGRPPSLLVSAWGVDHAVVEPAPVLPAGDDRSFVEPARFLLYVGQARENKGIPKLIESYRRSEAAKNQVPLVCVGRDFIPGRPAEDMLRDALGANGIAAGAVEDGRLRKLYARATALLLLSDHEGFGFPPLEAFAQGCPVIATDIPVLRETLGAHGVLIPPGDPDAVAKAINTALTVPDQPAARAARIAWAGRFRWQLHVADLTDAYRQAAAGR